LALFNCTTVPAGSELDVDQAMMPSLPELAANVADELEASHPSSVK
jgi:hypothetical protein